MKRMSKKRLKDLCWEAEALFVALHSLASRFDEEDEIHGYLIDAGMKAESALDLIRDRIRGPIEEAAISSKAIHPTERDP